MSEITAQVVPLNGRKHYGTSVNIALSVGPSHRSFNINVWVPVGRPSDEELADWGIDADGWENNVEVDDGWGGTEPIQSMLPSDGHYQSQIELAIANRIAEALEGFSV